MPPCSCGLNLARRGPAHGKLLRRNPHLSSLLPEICSAQALHSCISALWEGRLFLLLDGKRPFLAALRLLKLFDTKAYQFQGRRAAAGVTVFKTEIIDPFQQSFIDCNGIAWLFCRHSCTSFTVHIMHQFITDVKMNFNSGSS